MTTVEIPQSAAQGHTKITKLLAGLLLVSVVTLSINQVSVLAAEPAYEIPAPSMDIAASGSTAVATFAGGCFWGVQGVFQHVVGVKNAVSGYEGGSADTANYETTGTGRTGHAETVQITYDPNKVSYGELLQIFFSVAHNPTQLNYQGPDRGTQYRSTIFAVDGEQAKVAKAYIDQLGGTDTFPGKIVTTIETGKKFYPAEDYHQDFLINNPTYPYIVYNDLPKIENLKAMFPNAYSVKPVLVSQR
ncbi:peptide-methionine (S)-S-oxide reductase MsrA [Devosia rhodophyticola]|uniref:Peptide methionine sulfoxide reductase MsrA n=1 Tax=Devosia rhodophyticola TaxID=3026423 RepID=A0ABY7YXV7_9HYPH|nr:peptide-methionine (S)-S-oxide reductase MsrA [Devosia rhodophyticola]WDR05923.1 peptide-methionine (S)-S-oxide reductase MsrA [Devosia rhodophyticola]